jgi:hypothetical protein
MRFKVNVIALPEMLFLSHIKIIIIFIDQDNREGKDAGEGKKPKKIRRDMKNTESLKKIARRSR